MTEDANLRRDLLGRIEARRAAVQAYLRANRPRVRRRTTITIVLTSLAAASTAGPAIGGETFSQGIREAFNLIDDSYVWQVLCLLAFAVSLAAAILNNVAKSQNDVAQLATAEVANAELEGLSSLLQYGQLPLQDGVKLYQQYTVKIPFVDELPVRAGGGPAAPWPGDVPGGGPGPEAQWPGGGPTSWPQGGQSSPGALPPPPRRGTAQRPPPPPPPPPRRR